MTYKVVLPLDRPGFPQNPQGYNDVGAELIQKPCQNDQEIMDVTSDADAVLVSLIPISEKIIENMNPEIKKEWIPKDLKFFKGKGCDKCSNIGYKGRLGIYETIENSSELPKLVQSSDATNQEIEQAAIKNGTVTMIQDGLIKALKGETSLDEVLRVIKE